MNRSFILLILIVFIAGCISAFAFAPYECVPLLWFGMAVLFSSIRTQTAIRAAILGFVFGLGQFLFGVSWTWNSLAENGLSPAVAAISVGLFCSYLALYPALAAGVFRLKDLHPYLRALTFSALWTLFEWLRGTLFTGFSWLAIGYLNAGVTWLDGFAPLVGVYGLTFLTILSAALIAEAGYYVLLRQSSAAIITMLLSICWFPLGMRLSQCDFTVPAGKPLSVSLIQGNLSMQQKWGTDTIRYSQHLYLKLTTQSQGQLVIWPETGIPRYLDNVEPEYIRALLSHIFDHDKTVLTGVSMRELTIYGETARAFNSLALFDKNGMQYYHKRHLVPFGEYIPSAFRWVVDAFLPMSDFTSGTMREDNPLTLNAFGVHLAPTICYENAFGEEILDNVRQSNILINVSNLAWFGKTVALEQHFQISRLRALEMQRPMISSTNTGVTGAVDEKGRLIARLPNNTQGIIEVSIQGRRGETPYMRYGNTAILILCILVVCLAFMTHRRYNTC